MNPTTLIILAATVLGAAGIWMLLPGHGAKCRWTGLVLSAASLGLLASRVGSLGDWARDAAFWTLAGVTIAAAAGTVTFRNPIYCALWFALSLLSTAGLLLFQGSQFLAMATVVVYAGAILVTFLFVLMLAQPEGQAACDRVSWESLLAASAGAVLVGIMSLTAASVLHPPGSSDQSALTPNAQAQADLLAPDHVARLGTQLFGRHLLAVEVAGVLLLVAVVAAVAMTSAPPRTAEASVAHSAAAQESSHV